MIKEKNIQIKLLIKLIVVVVFAFLYAWGGMEMKWLRRFLAPAILCLSAFGFSRDWRYLLQAPFMMGALCMGYGGDALWYKIFRRGIFGLANGTASSVVNLLYKKWILVIFQIVLITSAFIAFGVYNPLPSARAEETILGAFIALITMISVKDKE